MVEDWTELQDSLKFKSPELGLLKYLGFEAQISAFTLAKSFFSVYAFFFFFLYYQCSLVF